MPFAKRADKTAYERERRRKQRDSLAIDNIRTKFSDAEIRAIVNGKSVGQVNPLKVKVDFHGEEVRFVFFTDPHMSSIYFHTEFMDAVCRRAEEGKARFIVCGGDVTNGMDERKYNLLYELTDIGYFAQKETAVKQFKRAPVPLYTVDGNHDRWFERMGGHIVEDICKESGAVYLGRDEGDLQIAGVTIKVFHGEDGNSYATSYRVQKIVEAFTGGEKPNLLLVGHTHKMLYMFERNIHAVSGGCLSTQSRWMRSKRIQAHPGFWFITMRVNANGIAALCPEWIPFYA